jgi:hypothetical protein
MKLIIAKPRALVRLEFGFAHSARDTDRESSWAASGRIRRPASAAPNANSPFAHFDCLPRPEHPSARLVIRKPDRDAGQRLSGNGNSVSDLARAASLAMEVFDKPGLFPFAVGQPDFMVRRSRTGITRKNSRRRIDPHQLSSGPPRVMLGGPIRLPAGNERGRRQLRQPLDCNRPERYRRAPLLQPAYFC